MRPHTSTLEVQVLSKLVPGWKLKEATDLGSLVIPRRGFQGHFLPGRDVPSGDSAAGGGAIRPVLLTGSSSASMREMVTDSVTMLRAIGQHLVATCPRHERQPDPERPRLRRHSAEPDCRVLQATLELGPSTR